MVWPLEQGGAIRGAALKMRVKCYLNFGHCKIVALITDIIFLPLFISYDDDFFPEILLKAQYFLHDIRGELLDARV